MRLLTFALLVMTTALPAAAANRVAMVVGNNLYANLDASQQLFSAHNDATSVAKALEDNGFQVFHGTDLTRSEFIQMLFDFTGTLGEGDIAVFFYAGHGVSIDGANYLLPSDIPATAASRRLEARRLASLSVHEQAVLAAMKESGAAVSLAILDACRDNPLKNAAGRSIGATRGLARMDIPQGTFSIYSAGYGQVALDRLPSDGKEANSVFTRVLLRKLAEPGMTLRQLALSTRSEVRELAASAGHVQSPAYYDELGTAEPVMLTLPAEETATEETPPRAGSVEDEIEMMIIDEIRDSSDPAELQAYLDTYPQGRFAAIARARLRRLGGETTASAEDLAAARKKVEDLTSARQADQMMIKALQVALDEARADSGIEDLEKQLESQTKRAAIFSQQSDVQREKISELQMVLTDIREKEVVTGIKNSHLSAEIQRLTAALESYQIQACQHDGTAEMPKHSQVWPVEKTSSTRCSRTYSGEGLFIVEMIGAAPIFGMVAASTKGTDVLYSFDGDNLVVRSGEHKAAGASYYRFGLRAGARAATVSIEATVLSEELTQSQLDLITLIACSTSFEGVHLGCFK